MKPVIIDAGISDRSRAISLIEECNKGILKAIRAETNYRMPKGYISWNNISAIVSLALAACEIECIEVDLPAFIHSYKMALWYAHNAPIYCISQELLEAFSNTDAIHKPDVLNNWKPSLPSFLLAVPKGTLHCPGSAFDFKEGLRNAPVVELGGEIDYIIVSCCDKSHPEWTKGRWKHIKIDGFDLGHDLYFQWAAIDTRENVWFSGTAIERGNLIYQQENSFGKSKISDRDKEFIERIRNLVINCLLCLEYSPEIVSLASENETNSSTKAKGFGNTSLKIQYPRWLGKNYQQKQYNLLTRSHKSPHVHWRKGHWRTLKPGESSPWKRHQFIWIEPTLVNG